MADEKVTKQKRAVACAEADLLGEALAALRDIVEKAGPAEASVRDTARRVLKLAGDA